MRVYLAGPISGKSYEEAVSWRTTMIDALKKFGITGINPMAYKEYLKNEIKIKDHYYNTMSTARAITTRDKFGVKQCDIMLVNLLNAESISIGTMIEIGWADMLGTPIVLVMEDGNLHEHAILNEVSAFRVCTLPSALSIIVAMIGDM